MAHSDESRGNLWVWEEMFDNKDSTFTPWRAERTPFMLGGGPCDCRVLNIDVETP